MLLQLHVVIFIFDYIIELLNSVNQEKTMTFLTVEKLENYDIFKFFDCGFDTYGIGC